MCFMYPHMSGGVVRPQYSRTPTPDSTRQSPVVGGPPSKIPVKKQVSGASRTDIEEDVFDEDDGDDEESGHHRNRVSFSNQQEIRNIVRAAARWCSKLQ